MVSVKAGISTAATARCRHTRVRRSATVTPRPVSGADSDTTIATAPAVTHATQPTDGSGTGSQHWPPGYEPARSGLAWGPQVADAAQYVVPYHGGDLLLVPAFEGRQAVGVLRHRFRLGPAGLPAAWARPPPQPDAQE